MNDINWKGGLFVDCTELNAMLDGLMDDTLSESQRQALEAHGRECPECAEAILRTKQLKALFDEMEPEADVPLQAQARWREAVRGEAQQKGRRRLYRWLSAAAAVLVVGIGVTVTTRGMIGSKSGAPMTAQTDAVEYAAEGEAPLAARMANVADEEYDMAESAVIEADGAAEAAAPKSASRLAAGNGLRAPACELNLTVSDVEDACGLIRDLAAEYEAEVETQSMENGSAMLYVRIDAQVAPEFMKALIPIDTGDTKPRVPELSGEGTLLVLLTVNGLP